MRLQPNIWCGQLECSLRIHMKEEATSKLNKAGVTAEADRQP